MKNANKLAALVKEHGGCAYYVGGCVRDRIMGCKCTDLDIEVHGIDGVLLEQLLSTLGTPIEMGKFFGIYGVKGWDADIALPRREHAVGKGHRDFEVTPDPYIDLKSAAMRRDFTINAMMEDILTGEVKDYFGGLKDLKAGILRHVDRNTFPEDPLRVLRLAQFTARLMFTPAKETVMLCKTIDLSQLSKERVEGELKKALLKAEKPSMFFQVLRETESLHLWFPEIKALIGVPQHKVYHCEGDVWNHTMMVLDEAAKLRSHCENPYGLMLTALCHDFGKAVCTTEKNGIHHAYGHETAGLPLAESFLRRITGDKKILRYVLNMCELHMKPNTLACAASSVKATNRMFDRSVDPEGLIAIALADDRGRISSKPAMDTEEFLTSRLKIYRETMSKPYVDGKDLVALGIKPDKEFKAILEHAHKLRLSGVNKETVLKEIKAKFKR